MQRSTGVLEPLRMRAHIQVHSTARIVEVHDMRLASHIEQAVQSPLHSVQHALMHHCVGAAEWPRTGEGRARHDRSMPRSSSLQVPTQRGVSSSCEAQKLRAGLKQ